MLFIEAEIERFLEDGFLVLPRALARETVAACRARVLGLLGVPEELPSIGEPVDCDAIVERLAADGLPAQRSAQPRVHLQHSFSEDPFDRLMSPRLRAALEELMGAGRWLEHAHTGWWPILFPGFPGPGGWHVDAVSRHYLTCGERGLVLTYFLSDVPLGAGGTALVRGSHREIARLLADADPIGLTPGDLAARLPIPDPEDVVITTGEAGDVAMLHPFLVHGMSPNRTRRVRVACTPMFPLHGPLQLDRPQAERSPVEEAVWRAVR